MRLQAFMRQPLSGAGLALALLATLVMSSGAAADQAGGTARGRAILPPELPWSGRSEALVVPADHPWVTPAETSRFEQTPRYEETVAWLRRLVASAPELALLSLGRTPEGRDLWMVVASRERARTPEALRASGKPTLLVQGGIHAGEIDGKDAGLMLLRDMTVAGSKRDLLDAANLLFVPIFNVDGHERFSAFTRINQRGPREAGWRTTSRNLNLNRDYAKLDAPEMRALVRALHAWDPDLYLDVHVTDGADYQYDITFGSHGAGGWSAAIGGWLDRIFTPAATADLKAMGHVPGPLIWQLDDHDLGKGILFAQGQPRFSTAYSDARHLPGVLVENHSLKPYRQRVLGTYVLLESAMRLLARETASLRAAVAADRARRTSPVVLDWKPRDGAPETIELAAVEWKSERGPSGASWPRWTGKPVALRVPLVRGDAPVATVTRPKAYWIPPGWPEVIERLEAHGVTVERTSDPRELELEMYRLQDPKLETEPFEGHVRVSAKPVPERRRERWPAGSVRVSTDQVLGDLVVLLLEPAAPDSFFQWGFFHEVLQPTEYVEAYIMEPMAEAILAEDAALRAELDAALRADPKLAGDPAARRQWLYSRTPFFDDRWRLYPVAREP
jgi:murein tripeptide amidase MpaA